MTADGGRAMRVISVDGWPGGPRVIEGLRPVNCIHGKRLRCAAWGGDPAAARANLCRLCEYEAPLLAKASTR